MRPFSTRAGAIAGALSIVITAAGTVTRPAAAEAQGTNVVDIRVADKRLVVGQTARVTGRLGRDRAGHAVTLEFRSTPSGAWTALATATVQPDGRYAFRRGLTRSGALRVVLQPPPSTAAAAGARPAASKAVAVALAPRVGIGRRRLQVRVGRRATVAGRVTPAVRGLRVRLEALRRGSWRTLARSRTRARGSFVLRDRTRSTGSLRVRVVVLAPRGLDDARRPLGRLNVFRLAHASWYGPGLYGRPTGCGGRLGQGQLGVAHKTLPCGTKVTLRHRGRTLRVPVMDRGPYVGGREYDLTAVTAQRLGFRGHGPILVTR